MNYSQTLDYLYSQLPMYQRVGAAAYKANLDNTYALLEILGHPQKNFKSIHIAGTNGKGSVAHMIASVLQEAGYKTGLHTSPHFKDFRERIKVNGEMTPQAFVVEFIRQYRSYFEKIKPSFFEMTVGMAFKYFEEQEVDIAVVEVGLGGRLDSTNVITPELSVITNISFDHQQFLGNTLHDIAIEKAGIIKKGIPVVIGETTEDTLPVFLNKARLTQSAIFLTGSNYSVQNAEIINTPKGPYFRVSVNNRSYPWMTGLHIPLTGYYQLRNLLTALQALEVLQQTPFKTSEQNIRVGLQCMIENTGILGRWQVLSNSPLVICDMGHNMAGVQVIIDQIKSIPYKKLHFVWGMVNDKEIDIILKLLPKNADYYFCKANIPRGLDPNILAEKARSMGLSGTCYASVKEAFDTAKTAAGPEGLVFVGGSTFVVAEVL